MTTNHLSVLTTDVELFFQDHPLARSVSKAPPQLKHSRSMRCVHTITRYASDNLVLAASGAVDFESLITSARQLCGEWKPSPQSDRKVEFSNSHARTVTDVITREQAALEYAVRMSLRDRQKTQTTALQQNFLQWYLEMILQPALLGSR